MTILIVKQEKILFTYSIFRKNQDGMKTTTCLLEKNDVTYPSKIKKYMQFPSRDHLRASLLNPSSDTLAMCVVAWLCLAPAWPRWPSALLHRPSVVSLRASGGRWSMSVHHHALPHCLVERRPCPATLPGRAPCHQENMRTGEGGLDKVSPNLAP
jgi:hypothetical protein